MKRWSSALLLWPVSLLLGCGETPARTPAPVPPIDAAAPARPESATFAVG
jgi:hypothetical protein